MAACVQRTPFFSFNKNRGFKKNWYQNSAPGSNDFKRNPALSVHWDRLQPSTTLHRISRYKTMDGWRNV